MLFNDLVFYIVRGISSVFEERDCDYCDGLPDRYVSINCNDVDFSHLAPVVVANLSGAQLLDLNEETFSISFNSQVIRISKSFSENVRDLYIHAV
jgi:hypothetical protein